MEQNKVVTLLADWSEGDEQVASLLQAVSGSKQIPVVAIFPAGSPYQAKMLSGLYLRAELIRKLKAAGPSRGTAPLRTAER